MSKCISCGNDIEDNCYCDNANGQEYIDMDYCRACREILKIVKKRGMRKRKPKVKTSDYHLPGFEYSKEKGCFVRGKGKK